MENLNLMDKEKFWNGIQETCPLAFKRFADWIDQYKRIIEWDRLFYPNFLWYSDSHSPQDIAARNDLKDCKIKYHDLPTEMQVGIFLRFASENTTCMFCVPLHWENIPRAMRDYFAALETFYQLDSM